VVAQDMMKLVVGALVVIGTILATVKGDAQGLIDFLSL
jgi:hypothetical protein